MRYLTYKCLYVSSFDSHNPIDEVLFIIPVTQMSKPKERG